MSTHEEEHGRPVAVVHAEIGGDAWRAVVNAQRVAVPDHADWYAIACEAVGTLRCLVTLADVLAAQVGRYGEARSLRDDAGMDPAQRLERAVTHAHLARGHLDSAERATSAFWSEIGRIAVEDER
mgnify:CR=1 FL=1